MDKADAAPAESPYALLDRMPVGVFVIDARLRVRHWNSLLEEWTGIPRGEMLGAEITARFPHLAQPKYLRRIESIFEGGPAAVFSSLLHRHIIPAKLRGGKEMLQNATAVPFTAADGEPLALVTVQDVTDLNSRINENRVARDAALKAKEEAENATALKDKFVALVSHDLKNPLSTMLGFLNLMMEDNAAAGGNADTKRMLEILIDSVNNMLHLIDDVLSLARLKAGTLAPQRRFIGLAGLASRTVLNFESQANKKGVRLINEIPEKCRVYADPVLLYEVLQNLVSNAIKFSRQGDVITLSLRDSGKAVIAVADTGIGIDPRRFGALFRYEERTSTTGTAGEVGTGFGLPLAHDIVKAHGGTLAVESAPGKGSVFYVTLPYIKPLVLLVDDDPDQRFLFRGHLNGLDVDIVEAEDGMDALGALKKRQPHLIITDISMPNMDGFKLLEAIKRSPDTGSIPVIVLTSGSDAAAREKAFRMGADDFITKGQGRDDFMPRITRFLS
ncbi:MAG: response regulator [Nitrospinae bacterium]|nr:response regulator [Nitrospinota bacterium]